MPLFDTIEEILARTYFNNTLGAWLSALLAAVVTLFLVWILRWIIRKRLKAYAQNTKTQIDDRIVETLQRTRAFFLLALLLFAGSLPLTLPVQVDTFIQRVVSILTLLQIGVWGHYFITLTVRDYVRARMAEDAASVTSVTALGFAAHVVLWMVMLLLALDNLGVNITALIAGLGIGGIAVALAAQNVLGDLFASLSIVLDKPFVLGDTIMVGDLSGTVEHIGLKTTRLRSLSGEQLIFANNDLLQSRIRNFKRMSERRALFIIGVVYQTPEEKLSGIPGMIKEIIAAQPLARFDRAHFKSFGDFSLNFEAVYFVTSQEFGDYMDTQQTINLAVLRRFTEEGIKLAYPTQTIYAVNANPA